MSKLVKVISALTILVSISAFSSAESAKTMYEKSILLAENTVFDLDLCISELVKTGRYYEDETIDCKEFVFKLISSDETTRPYTVEEIRLQHKKDLQKASKVETLQLEGLQQYYGYLLSAQVNRLEQWLAFDEAVKAMQDVNSK